MIGRHAPTLALALIAGALAWWAGGAPPVGFYADDAVYLLSAERLAGNHEPVTEAVARRSHLPPLYSLALAAVGARGDQPLAGHLLNGLLYAAALALVFALHARRQTTGLALLVAAMGGLLPGALLSLLTLWSEPLYMVLSLGCLLVVASSEQSRARWLAAGLLAGLALLTRSIAVALLAALLWRCARQARGSLPALLGGLAVPIAGWGLFGLDRDPETSYWVLLARVAETLRIDALLQIPATNLAALWRAWLHNIDLLGHPSAGYAAAALLALSAHGLTRRVARGETDALYVLAYLALLLCWPASADHFGRFLLPLMPLALGYAMDSALQVAGLLGRPGGAPTLLVGVLAVSPPLAAAMPSLTLMATRSADPLPGALAEYQRSPWWLRQPDRAAALADVRLRAATLRVAGELRLLVPRDACLYAPHVQLMMLHTRRVTVLPPSPRVGNPLRCEYGYAPGSLENVVLLDGVPPGSTLIHRATLPDDPDHVVGLLFKLPPQPTDNAADDDD